jgi:hypothetical protein
VDDSDADVGAVGSGVGTGVEVGGAGVVGGAEELMCRAVRAVEDEPATWTEKENCPVWVGMPEITPEEAAKLRPPGSWPEATFHVYGAMPPWASRATEYGDLTNAAGMLVVRILSAAGVTTKFMAFLD